MEVSPLELLNIHPWANFIIAWLRKLELELNHLFRTEEKAHMYLINTHDELMKWEANEHWVFLYYRTDTFRFLVNYWHQCNFRLKQWVKMMSQGAHCSALMAPCSGCPPNPSCPPSTWCLALAAPFPSTQITSWQPVLF